MYVSELINGHLYTEEYLTKRIMEVKLEINLLEELMENEDINNTIHYLEKRLKRLKGSDKE